MKPIILALQLDILMRNAEDSNSPQEVILFLEKLEIPMLPLIFLNNKELVFRIAQPIYLNYFLDFLQKIPVDAKPEFNFLKPNFISTFEFILGYIAYIAVSEDNSEQMLKVAAQFYSYHALENWINSIIVSYYKDFSLCIHAEPIIKLLDSMIIFYGTPGFLLGARFFYHLIQVSQLHQSTLEEGTGEFPTIVYSYIKNMIIYLDMASVLESQSQNEINNAYFGEGLSLSNPFYLDQITLIREKYLEFLPCKWNFKSVEFTNFISQNLCLLNLTNNNLGTSSMHYGETEFLIAVRTKKPTILLETIVRKNGPEILKDRDHRGNTALHIAILVRNLEAILFLVIRKAAFFEAQNNENLSPLDLIEEEDLDLLSVFQNPTVDTKKCDGNSYLIAQTIFNKSSLKDNKAEEPIRQISSLSC